MTGGPGITYDINIYVHSSGPEGAAIITVYGNHDGFPGNELFVARPETGDSAARFIVGYDPTGKSTPIALFPPLDKVMQKTERIPPPERKHRDEDEVIAGRLESTMLSKYWIGTLLLGLMHMGWCQGPVRMPHRYLIPAGYVGWIRVNFSVYNAQPLRLEDGFLIFNIPYTGVLNTSSISQTGWALDEYYSYDNGTVTKINDPRNYIWGTFTGKEEAHGKEPAHYEYFFVGDEKDYQKYGKGNKSGLPNIGPVQKQ